ncbi:hypothetical protein SAMN05216524_107165 [Mucilaginibacter sp. OK098]|nr:hypothetical protein SAMN05216524_107165 [Mucilaginibacter sp. OK098]
MVQNPPSFKAANSSTIRTLEIRTSAHQFPPHPHIQNPHIRTSKSLFQAENRPFTMHA